MNFAQSLTYIVEKQKEVQTQKRFWTAYQLVLEKILEDFQLMKRLETHIYTEDVFPSEKYESLPLQEAVSIWNEVAKELIKEGFEMHDFSVDEVEFNVTIKLKPELESKLTELKKQLA